MYFHWSITIVFYPQTVGDDVQYTYIGRDAADVDDVVDAGSIFEDDDDMPSLDDVLISRDTQPYGTPQTHDVAPNVVANGYPQLTSTEI